MRARPLVMLTASMLALAPASARAQEAGSWLFGAAGGEVETRYEPSYADQVDGTRSQFENRAEGLELQLFAGRRFAVSERIGLAVQATATWNDVKWTLDLPAEPAGFAYALPWAGLVTVAPELSLGDRVVVAGEVGGGLGPVRERKSSATTSSYDVDEAKPVLVLGGGLIVRLTRSLDVVARYRVVRYSGIDYPSLSPTGTVVEEVSDEPDSRSLSVGLALRR
jgi:opacity protein-like surface antigen